MCDCNHTSTFFADPLYRCPKTFRERVTSNALLHPEHFDSSMMDYSIDGFTAMNDGYYRCNECGGIWYLEFSPEEYAWPIFGVKSDAESRKKVAVGDWKEDPKVEESRQMALVLLLETSDSQLCLKPGCGKMALRETVYCEAHYGFPW
jgi:hypothetical protein